MHKKIVEAIQKTLEKFIEQDLVTVFVDSKETGGFWSMMIIIKPTHKHLMSHIETVGMGIGRLNGECLWCTKWENSIKFG